VESPESRQPRLAAVSLPKSISIASFSIPLAIALGSYSPYVTGFFNDHIAPHDLWNRSNSAWRIPLVAILLVLTLLMFLKQWSYYYVLGDKKQGFFVDTCGCLNDFEWTLDVALSFWGGLLFLSALRMPGYWLTLCALYSALVYARCHASLRRGAFAASWEEKGEELGPRSWTLLSTFPRLQIATVARTAGLFSGSDADDWSARLRVMRESLDWPHPTTIFKDRGTSRQLAAKEILAGWVWSHRLFWIFGAGFALVAWIAVYAAGPGPTAFLTAALLCLLQTFLFKALSEVSELWGIRHANQLTKVKESRPDNA
jgi:hypothetical protein